MENDRAAAAESVNVAVRDAVGVVTMRAPALSRAAGVDTALKWPNDLLVTVDGEERKAGGILAERVGDTAVVDRDNFQKIPQRDVVLPSGAGFEQVRSPQTPARVKPCWSWRSITASWVAPPNSPSTEW